MQTMACFSPMDPSSLPPETPLNPPKKSLPWVAVGIGCLGMLFLVLLGVVMLGWFAFSQLKTVAEEKFLEGKPFQEFLTKLQENPEFLAAESMLRLNSDLEIVSADPQTGTFVLKNRQNGEQFTIRLEDLKNGNFQILTGEEAGTAPAAPGSEQSPVLPPPANSDQSSSEP